MQLLTHNNENNFLDDNISIVSGEKIMMKWCEIVAAIFGFSSDAIVKFYLKTYNFDNTKLVYYQINGDIVGTGQVIVGNNGLAYIATIGVLEKYRLQGIGKKITDACLLIGKELGADTYALHATTSGECLYKSLAFKESSKWAFKVF